ncbi:hypothetical protein MPRS_20720 [Mycobacterium paraseoulense]|nr:hypothetical protein MPRS_20720 [Mycobacterium paraseoulense]
MRGAKWGRRMGPVTAGVNLDTVKRFPTVYLMATQRRVAPTGRLLDSMSNRANPLAGD